jgi:SAM-dependent methyltransferase
VIADPRIFKEQFVFQRSFARGKVVNIGCNDDAAGFRTIGGINVDLFQIDEHTGAVNPIHVMADARALPFKGSFDSAILGEILEHMQPQDAVKTIREAKSALKSDGHIVITMPHDRRRSTPGHTEPKPEKPWYAPGVFAYHYRMIPRSELFGWISEAGLQILLWAKIVYSWGEAGTGVVCH